MKLSSSSYITMFLSRGKHNLCNFSTYSVLFKETPVNLKGRKTSSQQWLVRQFKDPYVEKAKMSNYRCRSAFKLLEMDDKYKFLAPGLNIVDCGASPGSWTQVAVQRCNADKSKEEEPAGSVVGIDLLHIYPIPGAILLSGLDFTTPQAKARLRKELKDAEVDVFLSDMAPNATGVKTFDHENIAQLCIHALHFAVQVSKPGATFITKIWEGNLRQSVQKEIERFYSTVKIVKPPATRGDSAELYLLGRDFKGLKR